MQKTFSEDQITHQCNLLHAVERYGYIPEGNIRDFAKSLLQGTVPGSHPIHSILEYNDLVKRTFIKHLERTLKPLLYGISRKWRKTQDELLRATIKSFDRGYIRLVSEVPTGSGKSMVIGALTRAALDTISELSLKQEVHIITSRIAIAGQLIDETKGVIEENEDRPLEIGTKGDVRVWCNIPDEKIRVLAGNRGQNTKELEKDSLLTVSTYQGLTSKRVEDYFKKPAFIVICDESHRVTERVALMLDQMKAMTFGASATVLGPDRDPFFYFEKIERPEVLEDKRRKTYIDFLNYHKSIAEMIKDTELKPVRWINARRIRIDVSDALLRSSKGAYDVFNDASISRILAKNPTLGAEVVEEAYLTEHEGLVLSGSKPIHERKGIAFVDRIETARLCAQECNNLLPQKLKEKFGENVYFKAGYVSGEMSEVEYNKIIDDFRKGIITLLFSAEKIGEGVDLPFVNLIIPLRVLGFGSQWKLVQNLGRGLRVDSADPFGDLVVLDMIFVSDRHFLASVLGIFGRSSLISGGLLVGWSNNYELEQKVFQLIKKHKGNWTAVWHAMTQDEQRMFPFIKEKMYEEKARLSGSKHIDMHINKKHEHIFTLKSIQFVEHEEIRLALSLGNPEEMIRYTIEILQKEGFTSVDHIQSLRDNSLRQFSQRRFGRFRDGLMLVNFNLQKTVATLDTGTMIEFVELLRKNGMPERRSTRGHDYLIQKNGEQESATPQFRSEPKGVLHPKKSNQNKGRNLRVQTNVPSTTMNETVVTSLIEYTRDFFGTEPEIMTNFRDLYGRNPFYIGQASIQLPEGIPLSTTVYRNEDKDKVRYAAAQELYQMIQKEIKRGTVLLYKGSDWYRNHLKLIPLFSCERNYDEVYYTTTKRDGIYVIQASIASKAIKGMKSTGNPAIHSDEKIAQTHARVMLARELIATFPNLTQSISLKVDRRPLEKLHLLCEKRKIKHNSTMRKLTVENITLFKSTIRALGLEGNGYGISEEHAKTQAAIALYDELSKGGNQEN